MSFSNVRSAGIIAMSFDEGDELVSAALTDGQASVFMATREGQSIRFPEDDVRSMGRAARGVKGIELSSSDEVVGMEVLPREATQDQFKEWALLSVTANGYGKRTPIPEYREQGRGGSGIINVKTTDKTGPLVSVRKVHLNDDLLVISKGGQIIRTPVASISEIGRNTQGVRVITLDDSETVQGIAVIREMDGETVH
jgi:DNA gyrase subunit A